MFTLEIFGNCPNSRPVLPLQRYPAIGSTDAPEIGSFHHDARGLGTSIAPGEQPRSLHNALVFTPFAAEIGNAGPALGGMKIGTGC